MVCPNRGLAVWINLCATATPARGRSDGIEARWWSRLGSNQRPSACEADALPLSYRTGAERRTRSKVSTLRRFPRTRCSDGRRGAPGCTKKFVRPAWVDYRRASRRATISSVARGCSAVGSASPCQGEGRGFESRHPLGRCKWHQPQRWSGRVVRQRPAKPCTRVRFPSPPPFLLTRARLAQRESASLTRKRSLVQSQYRAPVSLQLEGGFQVLDSGLAPHMHHIAIVNFPNGKDTHAHHPNR